MNCAAQEIGGACDCGSPICSWRVCRHWAAIRPVEGPAQLIEADAKEYGAPGWNLRVEELGSAGWLSHIKHRASGNMVPRGPRYFTTRETALAEAIKLAAL